MYNLRIFVSFVLSLAFFVSSSIALAGTKLTIRYENKQPVTVDVSVLGDIFDVLDQTRAEAESELKSKIGSEKFAGLKAFTDIKVDFDEDVVVNKVVTKDGIDVRVDAYKGNINMKIKPCIGKRPKIDIDFSRIQALSEYNIYTGLDPFDVKFIGYDFDLSTGINICNVVVPIVNVFKPWIEKELGKSFKKSLVKGFEKELDLDVPGILGENTLLGNAISYIPSIVFVNAGINKDEVVSALLDPLEGTKVTLTFDEDGERTDDDVNDRIIIDIDVPWISPPRASFSYEVSGTSVAVDGSSSRDTDGGSIVRYKWDFGDGRTVASGSSTYVHRYSRGGHYMVRLTVTDDEGSTSTTSQMVQVSLCENGLIDLCPIQ
ncbi:Microbial collagenase [Thalassocella blandensis]|nr:Microbial collagenase [Thalassocella blandensis]